MHSTLILCSLIFLTPFSNAEETANVVGKRSQKISGNQHLGLGLNRLRLKRTERGDYGPATYQDSRAVVQTSSPSSNSAQASSAATLAQSTASSTLGPFTPVSALAPSTSAITLAPSIFAVATVCDKSQPKYEIKRFLDSCNTDVQTRQKSITTLCQSINSNNVQDVSTKLSSEISGLLSILTAGLAHIRLCGIDPRPLTPNNGVSVSYVADSAFKIVGTLKDTFTAISDLYKPYPLIETKCGDSLTNVSTSLSGIIGACSEQINLFDVGFFKLLGNDMTTFQNVPNHFSSFIGGFES